MKINIGQSNKSERQNLDYLYQGYRPVKSAGLYKKRGRERKWLYQLVVSGAILLVVFGLFRVDIPFTGYLKSGVKYLLTSDADIQPVLSKIIQLAANMGNLEWPLVDETSQPSKTAITELPPGSLLLLPVSGNIIRTYGWIFEPGENVQRFHEGIDIAVPAGTEVKASADGTVIDMGESGSWGKYILVKNLTGELIRYANLSEILVRNGQTVKAAEIIGKAGMTTDSRPHLHFEVIVNGRPVDPIDKLGLNFISASGSSGPDER